VGEISAEKRANYSNKKFKGKPSNTSGGEGDAHVTELQEGKDPKGGLGLQLLKKGRSCKTEKRGP